MAAPARYNADGRRLCKNGCGRPCQPAREKQRHYLCAKCGTSRRRHRDTLLAAYRRRFARYYAKPGVREHYTWYRRSWRDRQAVREAAL